MLHIILLFEKEIIPQIERESEEVLTLEKLTQMVQKVEDVISELDQKIEETIDVQEQKVLRSERKFPKQVRKKLMDFIVRKQTNFKLLRRRNDLIEFWKLNTKEEIINLSN